MVSLFSDVRLRLVNRFIIDTCGDFNTYPLSYIERIEMFWLIRNLIFIEGYVVKKATHMGK